MLEGRQGWGRRSEEGNGVTLCVVVQCCSLWQPHCTEGLSTGWELMVLALRCLFPPSHWAVHGIGSTSAPGGPLKRCRGPKKKKYHLVGAAIDFIHINGHFSVILFINGVICGDLIYAPTHVWLKLIRWNIQLKFYVVSFKTSFQSVISTPGIKYSALSFRCL